MMELFNGALTLNQNVMRALREAPDAVRRGFMLILFVGLLVGSANGVSALIQTATPARTLQTAREQFDRQFKQVVLASNNPDSQTLIQLINANEASFFTLFEMLLMLPTPLPRPVGQGFQLFATVVSTPISYLAGMLLAVAVIHLTARQLGGQGHLEQMIGLGSLAVAPHALDALAFIPGIGSTLGLVAWVWGLTILIAANAVFHRFDSLRATLAVFLYPLLLSMLGLLACCVLFAALMAVTGR